MTLRPLSILIPLDGSADAETVLSAVLPLAQRRTLCLTLLGVVSDDAPRQSTEAYLTKAQRVLESPGIHTRREVCVGNPAAAIVARATSGRVDLIAMATHGRTGVRRLLMGSVTESVLRQAPVPLLTFRPGCRIEGWTHVVALDGSVRAESVLDDLVPLTRLVGATLHLLHVEAGSATWGRPFCGRPEGDLRDYLKQLAKSVASLGVPAAPVVRHGAAGAEILRYALEQRAGWVAMATHGRTGLERVLVGSVAEEVLRKISCPVLLRRELRESAPLVPGAATA